MKAKAPKITCSTCDFCEPRKYRCRKLEALPMVGEHFDRGTSPKWCPLRARVEGDLTIGLIEAARTRLLRMLNDCEETTGRIDLETALKALEVVAGIANSSASCATLRQVGLTDESLRAIVEYQDAAEAFNALKPVAPRDQVDDYREDIDIAARRFARLFCRDFARALEKTE
jgi:hypothetical protein